MNAPEQTLIPLKAMKRAAPVPGNKWGGRLLTIHGHGFNWLSRGLVGTDNAICTRDPVKTPSRSALATRPQYRHPLLGFPTAVRAAAASGARPDFAEIGRQSAGLAKPCPGVFACLLEAFPCQPAVAANERVFHSPGRDVQ